MNHQKKDRARFDFDQSDPKKDYPIQLDSIYTFSRFGWRGNMGNMSKTWS